MRIPLIYIDRPLTADAIMELPAQTAHYLLQVLRLKPGRKLVLFNGDGRDYQAILITAERRTSARVEVLGCSGKEPPAPLAIHLGLGIVKSERMDFAVQKAVELGAASITPLLTEHCVVRIPRQRLTNRLVHWRKVALSACEQSGRRLLPEICETDRLPPWLNKHRGVTGILLDPDADQSLCQLSQPEKEIAILIGPEGGLTGLETELAMQDGFHRVRLGPRVLRTETALLAAISAIQTLWGDFR